MTHVVTEACIACKYTDCVDVCPVDCFREGPNFLIIDPDECIDCAVCIPECPAGAIYAEEDVPKDQQHMIKLNADLAACRTGRASPSARRRCPTTSSSKDKTGKLRPAAALIGAGLESTGSSMSAAPDRQTTLQIDCVIIGAGPVGLFQAFQLGLQEIAGQVVDALPHAGGQCVELYADKPIYDVPGHSGVHRDANWPSGCSSSSRRSRHRCT